MISEVKDTEDDSLKAHSIQSRIAMLEHASLKKLPGSYYIKPKFMDPKFQNDLYSEVRLEKISAIVACTIKYIELYVLALKILINCCLIIYSAWSCEGVIKWELRENMGQGSQHLQIKAQNMVYKFLCI